MKPTALIALLFLSLETSVLAQHGCNDGYGVSESASLMPVHGIDVSCSLSDLQKCVEGRACVYEDISFHCDYGTVSIDGF
jgi:hypothetical protein